MGTYTVEGRVVGIVYVVTNPAMPGLVKIGHTGQTIEQRLRDLDKTGTAIPFECVAAWSSRTPPGLRRCFIGHLLTVA